nr:MAG TPA: hypothetical protein [Caudoviricetes sp.]
MISHRHTSRYMRIHNVFVEVSALFFAFLCPPSFLLRFCLVSTILLRKICRCVATVSCGSPVVEAVVRPLIPIQFRGHYNIIVKNV